MISPHELEICRDEILKGVNKSFEKLAHNIKQESEPNDSLKHSKSVPLIEEQKNKEYLKEKNFISRPSILTEMLEINHIKTIYNIFVAILVVFSLNTIVFDIIEGDKFVWDFQLITYSLGKLNYVVTIWCWMMFATTLILFPLFRFWVSCHILFLAKETQEIRCLSNDEDKDNTKEFLDNGLQDWVYCNKTITTLGNFLHKRKTSHSMDDSPNNPLENMKNGTNQHDNLMQNVMSWFWLTLYFAYQILFVAIPIYYIVVVYDIPPASSFIVMLEQMRLLMKSHSFVHENVTKIVNLNHELVRSKRLLTSKDIDSVMPNFSNFLYFLFAPTLIYRDNYPRTQTIRWDYVLSNLAQVLTCLFYTYYIFVRFCIPVFKHFNQDHLTPKTMILSIFGSMLPGTMVLIIAFFGVLHSWLNAFAEMLRFADRMFYKDWWNSTSFTQYYRTWNVVVHDWLYLYIYKDIILCVKGISRPMAMLIVFQISALAHELVISVAFRFFYPVLLVLFGIIGFGAMFITNSQSIRASNILLWVMMFMGNGLLMTLYSMEWYARKNCHSHIDSKWVDFFVPRSWYCERLK